MIPVYNLANITRYSTIPTIRKESVAEHSYFVSTTLVELYKDYRFDLGKACVMAIIHDWPEMWLGDIIHSTKSVFSHLNSELKLAEQVSMLNACEPYVYALWREYVDMKSGEALIVKYADVLQCRQFAEQEKLMGNNAISDVITYSVDTRLSDLLTKIQHLRR